MIVICSNSSSSSSNNCTPFLHSLLTKGKQTHVLHSPPEQTLPYPCPAAGVRQPQQQASTLTRGSGDLNAQGPPAQEWHRRHPVRSQTQLVDFLRNHRHRAAWVQHVASHCRDVHSVFSAIHRKSACTVQHTLASLSYIIAKDSARIEFCSATQRLK